MSFLSSITGYFWGGQQGLQRRRDKYKHLGPETHEYNRLNDDLRDCLTRYRAFAISEKTFDFVRADPQFFKEAERLLQECGLILKERDKFAKPGQK